MLVPAYYGSGVGLGIRNYDCEIFEAMMNHLSKFISDRFELKKTHMRTNN